MDGPLVNQMRQKYPDNFIGLAGISAGSGQVVSYIGKEGSNVQVNAAASLCPAWDISSAFRHLQQRHPWVDRYVTRGIVNHFLRYVPFCLFVCLFVCLSICLFVCFGHLQI